MIKKVENKKNRINNEIIVNILDDEETIELVDENNQKDKFFLRAIIEYNEKIYFLVSQFDDTNSEDKNENASEEFEQEEVCNIFEFEEKENEELEELIPLQDELLAKKLFDSFLEELHKIER